MNDKGIEMNDANERRYWKAGNIDYKNVPEIAGADLDQYRGEGSWVVKVSVDRSAKATAGEAS